MTLYINNYSKQTPQKMGARHGFFHGTLTLHVVLNSVVMGSSVVIVMVVLPGVLVVGMGLACRTNDGLRRR